MTPALRSPAAEPSNPDQRVFLHGVSWREYEALLAMRGERAVPRISYLEGELELMSPSEDHEDQKKRLARLLEAWSEGAGIDIDGYGSWTLKKELKERGSEPDECYIRNQPDGPRERPDLAIEVIWTSGGINKLEIYRGLEVPEVWFWRNEKLVIYVLQDGAYVEAPRSHVLPEFDPSILERYMRSDLRQGPASRALREEVQRSRR